MSRKEAFKIIKAIADKQFDYDIDDENCKLSSICWHGDFQYLELEIHIENFFDRVMDISKLKTVGDLLDVLMETE